MNAIKYWLESNGSFEDGLRLFELFGNNQTWLSTFQNIGESEFTSEQLHKQLSSLVIVAEAKPEQLKQELSKQIISTIAPSDLTDAPEAIKEAVNRRKYLYSSVNREHERLIAYVESQSEFKAKLSGEIKMRDVIKAMDKLDIGGQAIPFNIIAITANAHKDTGGEILHLQGVFQNKYRVVQEREVKTNFDRTPMNTGKSANPLANRIRRIFITETNEVKNVDMVLITHFNWKRMIY
ncbi:hypothetical protein [Emticicia sp.]|uniref:hypothetical protein n=1 Tax=Emticicia sp. TaxID=1930953 RepID=UPI003752F9D9